MSLSRTGPKTAHHDNQYMYLFNALKVLIKHVILYFSRLSNTKKHMLFRQKFPVRNRLSTSQKHSHFHNGGFTNPLVYKQRSIS